MATITFRRNDGTVVFSQELPDLPADITGYIGDALDVPKRYFDTFVRSIMRSQRPAQPKTERPRAKSKSKTLSVAEGRRTIPITAQRRAKKTTRPKPAKAKAKKRR